MSTVTLAVPTSTRNAADAAIKAARLDSQSKLILHYINDRRWYDKAESYLSWPRLASETGMSVSTVARRISALRKSGWLTVRKARSQYNVYTIVPQAADIRTEEEIAAPVRAARAVTDAKQDAFRAARAAERASGKVAPPSAKQLALAAKVAAAIAENEKWAKMLLQGLYRSDGSRPPTQKECFDAARATGVPEDECGAHYSAILDAWRSNREAKEEAKREAARMVAEADADSEPAPWQRADRQQTYADATVH